MSALRARYRCHILFNRAWLSWAMTLSGLAFFFLMVYYFGFMNLGAFSAGKVIFDFILPMLLLGAMIVLLRGIRLQVTPIYGALCVAYCFFMIVRAFGYANAFQTIVALVWYPVAAAVCVAVTMGVLAKPDAMVAAFLVPVVYRLLFVDIGMYLSKLAFVEFLPEASALCAMASFAALAASMKAVPLSVKRRHRAADPVSAHQS